MNTRLQQFLDLENLTPARLADIIGVQRSGLSHILSGRNKPSFDFIKRILVKFPRVNAEWLITGKGKPYKDFEPTPTPISVHSNTGENFGPNKNFSNNGNFGNSTNLSTEQNFSNGRNFPSGENFDHDRILDDENFSASQNSSSGGKLMDETSFGSEGVLEFEENFENSAAGTDFFTESANAHHMNNTTQTVVNKQFTQQNNSQQPPQNRVNASNLASGKQKRSVKRVIIFYSDGSFEELFPRIR